MTPKRSRPLKKRPVFAGLRLDDRRASPQTSVREECPNTPIREPQRSAFNTPIAIRRQLEVGTPTRSPFGGDSTPPRSQLYQMGTPVAVRQPLEFRTPDDFSTPESSRTPIRRTNSAVFDSSTPENVRTPLTRNRNPPAAPKRNVQPKRRYTDSPGMLREQLGEEDEGAAVSVAQNLSFGPTPLDPAYEPDAPGGYMSQIFDGDRHNIGAGDFGVVVAVRRADRDFAIKMQSSKVSASTRHNQLREVFFLEQLNHPNVVKFDGAWEEFGSIHIATELCSHNLMAYMKAHNGCVPEIELWNALLDGLRGLEYVHSRRVLHLDVKPENMLMSPDGVIKLADFGMAYNMDKDRPDECNLDGDGRYLAPEAFDEFHIHGVLISTTPKRDVFSLGVSIFQLATGLQMSGKGNDLGMARTKNFPDGCVERCAPTLLPMLWAMMENEWAKRPEIAEIWRFGEVAIREAARRFHLTETLGIEFPEIAHSPIPDSEWEKLMDSKTSKPMEHNHTIG